MNHWLSAVSRSGSAPVRGVIHIGANDGAEHPVYLEHGIRRQLWVEPQPEPFARLVRRTALCAGVLRFNVACGSRNGGATLHVMEGNEGHSSSLLPPKLHLKYYPHLTVGGRLEVPLARLDDLLAEHHIDLGSYNLLVLDVQGYELECLRGSAGFLDGPADYVLSEVYVEELYEGCARIEDLDAHLGARGFVRESVEWAANAANSWGDALYVRDRVRKEGRR